MTEKNVSRRAFVSAGALGALAGAALLAGCNQPAPSGAEGSGSAEGSATTEGSGSAAGTETFRMTDMRGREVDVPKNVEKLVAIGCAQRFACYLGAADRLIAVEESDQKDQVGCTYRHVYHDILSGLQVTGDGGPGGMLINEEALIAAQPQMILADWMDVDTCNAMQERTGIPVVALDQPETVFDEFYYENMMVAGKALGVEDRAKEIVDYIKGVQKDISDRVGDAGKDIKAYAGGITYSGGHGLAGTEPEFPPFLACGVQNIADGHGSDTPFDIDLEEVIAAQPDYIFVECGNLELIKEDLANYPDIFNALTAVTEGRTYTLVSHRWYSTNVEIALANCYQVASAMFPEQMEGIDPTQKIDEITQFMLDSPACTFFDSHRQSEDLAAEGQEYKQIDLLSL